ncbi:MAG: WYL domain-containing protein [Desulfovibrionaceae bacterium]|nr:WYL domain-containing protein [Desulfovibrionaceae bacterium]
MPKKIDPDSSPGTKLLRIFRKLFVDGKRHFQTDLATEFNCSPQTVMRIMSDIEAVLGCNVETGIEKRKRWYSITSRMNRLGLNYEELRYLSICLDLAKPLLPASISQRVDETIFNLSVFLVERANDEKNEKAFAFYSKGKIDYSAHSETLEKLLAAVMNHCICSVTYKAAGRTSPKVHTFVPTRLIGMNQILYAYGALIDEDTLTIRHTFYMAVHRIQSIAVHDRRFTGTIPEHKGNSFGFPWHEPRAFRIYFSRDVAEYVRERIWADEQRFEDCEDGGLILHITTRSEPELQAWVRSFGDKARFLENDECVLQSPNNSMSEK